MKEVVKKEMTTFFASGHGCSLLTFLAMLQEHDLSNFDKIGIVSIGSIAMLILTLVLSYVIGGKIRWQSIVACLLACVTVYIAVALGVWFNILSA